MRSLACAAFAVALGCGGAPQETASPSDLSAAPPTSTVVFIRGMGGFQRIAGVDYFYQVPQLYTALGARVLTPDSAPFNTIESRAAQLKARLDQTRGPLILLAHSQGGLDARWLVSRMGYAQRVRALVTIATPHHGTQIADVVAGLLPPPVEVAIDDLVKPLGWSADEIQELTTANMEQRFNPQVPDAPQVRYWSYSGQATPFGWGCHEGVLHAALLAGWTVLDAFGQQNDGVVPERSAHWGEFQGTLTADHLAEVNQPLGVHRGFDARAFYLGLLRRFHDEGW